MLGRNHALGLATQALKRLSGQQVLLIDYPPSADNRPRWGYGRPPHRQIERRLGCHHDRYRESLATAQRYANEIPAKHSPWLGPLDRDSLHGFIREREPATYLEIGSGDSTRIAHRAAPDTCIVSIDPQPRANIDTLCNEVIRQPLETVPLGSFESLCPGDIVFFDGSHRVFMNSDATVFFLDALPRFPSGVLVGIHDIHLPFDYPPEAARVWPSEQYLLAAMLLAGDRLNPVLPCNYVANHPDFKASPGLTFWATT